MRRKKKKGAQKHVLAGECLLNVDLATRGCGIYKVPGVVFVFWNGSVGCSFLPSIIKNKAVMNTILQNTDESGSL